MVRAVRKLKATWTLAANEDLVRQFIGTVMRVDYDYVAPARWWQFWRWHLVLSEDYCLSRAAEFVLIRRATAEMQRQIDRELRDGS